MNHEKLNVNIELTSIVGAQIQKDSNGNPALIIPINPSENDLSIFTDKNGKQRVYLPISLWPKKNLNPATGVDEYGYSHDAVQSYSKAKRESLPAGIYPPRLGRARPIGGGGAQQAQSNQSAAPQGYVPVNGTGTGNGDMPF